MKKNLPSIYKSPINGVLNNNKNSYYSKINEKTVKEKDISLLKEYIFNSPVIIELSNEIVDAVVVSNRNDYIITNTNRKINVDDIISIKRKGQ